MATRVSHPSGNQRGAAWTRAGDVREEKGFFTNGHPWFVTCAPGLSGSADGVPIRRTRRGAGGQARRRSPLSSMGPGLALRPGADTERRGLLHNYTVIVGGGTVLV